MKVAHCERNTDPIGPTWNYRYLQPLKHIRCFDKRIAAAMVEFNKKSLDYNLEVIMVTNTKYLAPESASSSTETSKHTPDGILIISIKRAQDLSCTYHAPFARLVRRSKPLCPGRRGVISRVLKIAGWRSQVSRARTGTAKMQLLLGKMRALYRPRRGAPRPLALAGIINVVVPVSHQTENYLRLAPKKIH